MKPAVMHREGVLAELKALRQAYGEAQQRCTASLTRMHRRNQALEAEVMRLRAKVIARDTALAWAREDQARLLATVPGLPSRVTLARRIEALAARMQGLLRMVLHLEERLPAAAVQDRGVADAAGRGADVVSGQGVAGSGASTATVMPADAAACGPGALGADQRSAGSVAGRVAGHGKGSALPATAVSSWSVGGPLVPGATAAPPVSRLPAVPAAGSAHAGLPEDDGEDIPDLEERLVEADLVICQTGCLSHQAYWRMQDHCRRHNKPCVLVAQPDALRIVRIHNRDETVAAAPAMPADAPSTDAAEARMPDTMGFGAAMDDDSNSKG